MAGMAPRHAGLPAGGALVVCAYHPAPAVDCDIPRARQKKLLGDSAQMDITELASAGESSLESVETTSMRSDTECKAEPGVIGVEISGVL